MDDKYYCNRLITFQCHSSRKFRIHLASIAVASSDLFCIFWTPIFNDLYPPTIFEFSKVTNHRPLYKGVHVRTCGNTQNLRGASQSAVWCPATYQIWAKSDRWFQRYVKVVCTCARAGAPRIWEVLQQLLYDTCLHTMFQSNRTSSFGDTKKGCARAHVRQHSKSEGRATICCMMPGHIPNLSKIGPVVSEIRKRGVHVRTCGSTPCLRCASVSGVWYPSTCKIWTQSAQPF